MNFPLVRLVVSLLCVMFAIPTAVQAGPIRERIKERWIKKQEEKPAPETNAEATKKIEKPGDFTFSIPFGGTDRYYMIHVPKKYDSSLPTPVVFVLHGGGGDMSIQATDEYYKQISKSEQEGYIVVFPNGASKLKSGKFATWNAGKCCGAARDTNSDDVGFIKQIVKNITAQLHVDPKKIFAAGMSNGGMMSYRLACEASDIFKAIASVAGTDNTITCAPKTPISVLHIHAKDDDHVLFNGGAGKNAFQDKTMVTEFNSVPSTIAKWTKLNGCEATPRRVLEKAGASCELYEKCHAGTQVQLCVTETGGHSWPGGKKPRGGGAPSQAISANDVMWDFFKTK